MNKFCKTFTSALCLCILSASSLSGIAAAATPSSTSATGSGYRISPVRTDLTLNPGQTKVLTLFLTNVSPAPENLQITANDFQARDESGTPAILLNGASTPQHGLKQYLLVPSGTLNLKPGQQAGINVQVKLPANIVPGGYYGAVRFAPASISGTKSVNLAASVASLILVRVAGPVHENLSVASFQVAQKGSARSFFTSNKNLQGVIRLLNNGDVQEEPFGKILLQKGKNTPGAYEVNNVNPRGNVLPGSIRRFTVNLDKVGSFGKYKLVGSIGYGTSGQVVNAETTFYVIPLALIITVVGVIVLIIFLIFVLPRLIRGYNQRVIRRAQRRR